LCCACAGAFERQVAGTKKKVVGGVDGARTFDNEL